jgi:hypothetical protein
VSFERPTDLLGPERIRLHFALTTQIMTDAMLCGLSITRRTASITADVCITESMKERPVPASPDAIWRGILNHLLVKQGWWKETIRVRPQ